MEAILTKDKEFRHMIHIIRGQQIILDYDLAKLYGTEVKKLIQQVKRNMKKFPDDFMFQLSETEMIDLSRSQNVTSIQTKGVKGGRSYKPYAFTEQGIYMVATILKNDIATQQSIYIMRSFKKMRHYIAENRQLLNNTDLLKLTNYVIDQDMRISTIETNMATKSDIDKIMDNFIKDTDIKEKIFFEGQVFDAAEAYINIYKQAKKSIYIIDDYVNFNTLSLLKRKQTNVTVTIFTRNRSKDRLINWKLIYLISSIHNYR